MSDYTIVKSISKQTTKQYYIRPFLILQNMGLENYEWHYMMVSTMKKLSMFKLNGVKM